MTTADLTEHWEKTDPPSEHAKAMVAAMPDSTQRLTRYIQWLENERRHLLLELGYGDEGASDLSEGVWFADDCK